MQEVSKITQDHFVKMPFPASPLPPHYPATSLSNVLPLPPPETDIPMTTHSIVNNNIRTNTINSSSQDTTLTKIVTWNIDKQATYDVPIKACIHVNIVILHCTEPATHMTLGTLAISTLINTTDKAGYYLYVTDHSHKYLRQATIYTRLVSQLSIYNRRLYTFIFKGDDMRHTAVLCIYIYQRARQTHDQTTTTQTAHLATPIDAHSLLLFKKKVLTHANELRILYTP